MATKKIKIRKNLKLNVFDSSFERQYRTRKTIIFVHGGGGSLANWKYQLPYFSQKYRTIAYDWRGCRASDRAPSYTFDDHYQDFLALLKLLKVPSDFVLVGHSYGCLIGQRYASEHQVKKFVNSCFGLTIRKVGWLQLPDLPSFLRKPLYKRLVLSGNPILAKRFLASPSTPLQRIKELLEENKIPSLEFFLDLKTFREGERAVSEWISGYQGKMLVVGGDQDRIATLEGLERLRQLVPRARLEIVENTGHLTPYEAPDRFNKLIENFIEEGF